MATTDKARSGWSLLRLSGWLKVAGFAILAILFVSAVLSLRSGMSFLTDAHRRNNNALSVAANGLQYWPNSILGIARSQLLSDNVHLAPPQQQLDGWNLVYPLHNPDLGTIDILYAFRNPVGNNKCVDLQDKIEKTVDSKLPFVNGRSAGSGATIEVFGTMPFAEARILDFTQLRPWHPWGSEDMVKVMNKVMNNFNIKPPHSVSDMDICYGASVPTAKLLAFEQTKSSFSDLLIVDAVGRVVQQVGDETLPIVKLDHFQAGSGLTADPVKTEAAVPAAAEHPAPDVGNTEPELPQALAARSETINGRTYFAYVRPFHLAGNLQGCDPQLSDHSNDPDPWTFLPVRPTANSGVPSASAICYLVGLVPRTTLLTDAMQPSRLFVLVFGLINGLVLCVLPIVRLLLMGPRGSLRHFNLALIIGGGVIGISLITLALLTWTDIYCERERMNDEATGAAGRIADGAFRDLHLLIDDGLRYSEDSREPKILNAIKSRADAETVAVLPDVPGQNSKTADRALSLADMESAESIVHLAPDGYPVACKVPEIYKHDRGTNRFELTGRDYFKRFINGEFSDTPKPPALWGGPGPHYVVDQIRSQTGGVNEAVVLVQALNPRHTTPPNFHPRPRVDDPPCQTAGYLITGVIGSLVSPVLPSGLMMAVVDTNDPTLPVKFDSRPALIGVEHLADEIDLRPLQDLRQWLDYSGASDKASAKSFSFAATYEGANWQFVAQRIPGTPWLVIVSYPLAEVDELPVHRTARAIVSGLTLGFVPLFFWGLSAWLLPGHTRKLWPHEEIDPQSENRVFGKFSYSNTAYVLASLTLWEAPWLFLPGPYRVYIIASLVTLAVAILYVESNSQPRLKGPVSSDNERAFARLSVFFCCVSVMPSTAVWKDAKTYTDAQERLKKAIAFSGADGSVARHWQALDAAAKNWFPANEPKFASGKIPVPLRDAHVFVPSDSPYWASQAPPGDPAIPGSFYGKWFAPILNSSSPPELDVDLAGDFPSCPPVMAAPVATTTEFGSASDYFCVFPNLGPRGKFGYTSDHDWMRLFRLNQSKIVPFLILVIGIIVCWAIWLLLRASQRALFGFGTPFGQDIRRPPSGHDRRYPLRNALLHMEARIAECEQDLPSCSETGKAFRCLVLETIPLPRDIIFKFDTLARDGIEQFQPVPSCSGVAKCFYKSCAYLKRRLGPRPRVLVPSDRDQKQSIEIVIDWARRLAAPSRIEAVHHLQQLLTPYYKSCWDGLDKSRSEKIVLYNLANRRLINVGHAAPSVAALLRQGLIVFDPAPRPMNESFAAFVRAVEQRAEIQKWAVEEGRGAFSSGTLIWVIAVPLLVISSGLVLFWANVDVKTILPVFVTGIPALITVLTKLKSEKTA